MIAIESLSPAAATESLWPVAATESLWLAMVATLVVGLTLQPLVLRLMTSASILDIPSDRSSHTVATPRGGGVAVIAAVAVALQFLPAARALVVPVLLCAAIGLVEDVRGVPIPVRLALLLTIGGVTGVLLMPSGQRLAVELMIVAVVAFWLTAFANAFNFMDGINGISAMYAIVAGIAYAVVGVRYDLVVLTTVGAVIAVAALTFLPWNAGRARIFLGDVGSYGLGAGLGSLAAYGALHDVPIEVVLAPLAVYLADTGWTLLRRVSRGEAWYRPHRTHAYQRLTNVGWSHRRVAIAVAALSAVLTVCAVAGSAGGPLSHGFAGCLGFGLLTLYLALPGLLSAHQQAAGRRASSRSSQRAERQYV